MAASRDQQLIGLQERVSPPGRIRLALIGPVPPFRGGIAQHTTMLHRTARCYSDLLTVSFTRQYPAWIFPGRGDRDPCCLDHHEEGVEYLIDSLDPFSWRRAADRVIAHHPRIVIIPWWTIYWVFCFRYLARRFRKAGITVLFLCHNVVDHESARWKAIMARQVLQQAHAFLVQSRKDEQILRYILPQAKIHRHPHPLYDQFPEAARELPRRANQELLFFGLVRPYKGLDLLIEALGMLPPTADFFLTIAGEFWQGKRAVLKRIEELSLRNKIEILDEYIPDQEVAGLFQRADMVVLPYRSATGSGVIPLAYHYDKPVIVTRVGGLPDAVTDRETGLIVEPENPRALAAAISGISREKLASMAVNIAAHKHRFSWEGLLQKIMSEA
jgi:glycosyltransferase involved in cell wall biosynthesis